MTIADRGQPVVVHVGDCRCPGSPHAPDGDTVYLKPEVDVPLTLAFNVTFETIGTEGLSLDELNADMQGAMAGVYLRNAITGWSFTDDKGQAIPIRPKAIQELLPPAKGGLAVANVADGLYSAALLAPFEAAVEKIRAEQAKTLNRELRRQTRKSSPRGRTAPSTPATNGSGSTRRKPSAPSLPETTAGMPSTA